ncbi:MAG TPA: M20 family metallopeptidase [Acidisarcina sp.]|nr:M20 family metallopeptidase [Acidisarcina sp.]
MRQAIEVPALLAEAVRREKTLLDLLATLVRTESPSENKAAVDACVALVERRCTEAGASTRRYRNKQHGDLLLARFGPPARGRKPLMLLGHLDTVWPLGTLQNMPFQLRDGRAWGPGVLDMKAGVAMALTALEILQTRQWFSRPVVLLLNSEEETGSEVSRPVTEKIASASEAVFVLEPAQGLEGAYKTARKGVGTFRLQVRGVAAHSGLDFERGHSAILELAHVIEKVAGFTDLKRGITVNTGVMAGGTRSNVVAAEAWAEVDLRIARRSDGTRIEKRFQSLRTRDKQCVLTVEGGLNRPPMERTAGTVKLFRRAQAFVSQIGIALEEASSGGGSDGNFTSALGVPTLDGMGAVGEGAHAAHESIVLEHLAPRTALLAAMMANPG